MFPPLQLQHNKSISKQNNAKSNRNMNNNHQSYSLLNNTQLDTEHTLNRIDITQDNPNTLDRHLNDYTLEEEQLQKTQTVIDQTSRNQTLDFSHINQQQNNNNYNDVSKSQLSLYSIENMQNSNEKFNQSQFNTYNNKRPYPSILIEQQNEYQLPQSLQIQSHRNIQNSNKNNSKYYLPKGGSSKKPQQKAETHRFIAGSRSLVSLNDKKSNQLRQQKDRTKKTLDQLQEKIREKFEISTNPLCGNRIEGTKLFLEDVRKYYQKEDVNGVKTNQINEHILDHFVDFIDIYQDAIKEKREQLNPYQINEDFTKIMTILKQSGLPLLYLQAHILKAKFNLKIGNVYGCLREIFQCKTFARLHKYPLYKVKCYKIMGKAYMEIKNYEKAKNAFLKLLIIAWYLDNSYLEIIAYDQLGMIYFYLGDIGSSRILHQKSLNGKVENSKTRQKKVQQYNDILNQTEDERNLRKLKQQSYRQKKNNVESDGNFDPNQDSSEEEQEGFLKEIISNQLLNKNKEVDWFEVEREKSLKYRLMKKKKRSSDTDSMYFDSKKIPFLQQRLSHQSHNRATQNFKQMNKYDLLAYSNKEEQIFCFLITPKSYDYLKAGLQKIRKKIYLAKNEIEKFRINERLSKIRGNNQHVKRQTYLKLI